MVEWVCANCGARYDTHDPPCRSCAGEEFARLEDSETERIESTASVTWVCTECGQTSPKNETACRNCGSLQYVALDEDRENPPDNEPTSTGGAAGAAVDTARGGQFYLGVVLGVLGVVFLPFIFGIIAFFEGVVALFGRSIRNLFPRDTRDNAALRGSFLIFRWVGYLMLLLFLLGVALGILLAV